MKKEDLKTGMLVECRDGNKYLVLRDTPKGDIVINKDGFNRFDLYDENLRAYDDGWFDSSCFDIMKVYDLEYEYHAAPDSWDKYKKILWERRELNGDEKVILKNLDPMFKYIARDRSGSLYVYEVEPIECECGCGVWDCNDGECTDLEPFDHLFKFIDSDTIYLISDLIK